MARSRSLTPDEKALWAKVMATVQPLHPRRREVQPAPAAMSSPPAEPVPAAKRPAGRVPPERPMPAKPQPLRPATLDGGWDKRISRGLVAPESSIDLHGHTLSSAYVMLDRGLDRAIQRGDRVLLLVTGKPPRPESERPHARGAIRAAVGDWIGASRHADRIAAIRPAHPRHGGQGALYIILRRPR